MHAQKLSIQTKMQRVIDNFVKDTMLHSASISISVIDIGENKIVGSFDSHRSLIPASSQKIMVTAALLSKLGNDYRYQTKIYLKGTMSTDSTFIGNIVVEGKGDPSFCSYSQDNAIGIQTLVDRVKSKLDSLGIKEIKGYVEVDASYIKDIPENPEWLWYDLGNYYGAGCYGLNVFENAAWVSVKQETKSGEICEVVKVVPNALTPMYCSEVKSSVEKTNEDLFVLGSSQDHNYTVHGSLQCCGNDTITLKAAIPDPPQLFAKLLMHKLKDQGIIFSKLDRSKSAYNKILLYNYTSPPLRDLAERALKKSVNLYCESFVHTYGDISNANTDRKKSLSNLESFWESNGLDAKSMVLEDGSGLSPKNLLSSMHLCKALSWIEQNRSDLYFWYLLPDSSSEGSLASILSKNKKAKSKLRLKSGSMERVRSYSGYIIDKDKPRYAISLIVNHYSCKSDEIKNKIGNFFVKMSEL